LTASIEKKHDDFRRQNEEVYKFGLYRRFFLISCLFFYQIKNIDSSEDVVFVDELEDTKDDLLRSQVPPLFFVAKHFL